MDKNKHLTDDQVVKRVNAAVRLELEKLKELGIDPVLYDRETRTIYKQHQDGSRTIIHQREGSTIFNE